VVTLNELFVMFGGDASEAGWSLIDTVVVLKVLIGLLAAVVGALAVTAAAKHDQKPGGRYRRLVPTRGGG
jgi:hypothetical protein